MLALGIAMVVIALGIAIGFVALRYNEAQTAISFIVK